MADNKTRVTFALDYATADGKNHRGGSEVNIDADEARDLIHRGIVRVVNENDLPPTQLEAPAPSTDKAAK